MKKLLSILATLGLTATSSTSVIACTTDSSNPKPALKQDLSKLITYRSLNGAEFITQETALEAALYGTKVKKEEVQVTNFKKAGHDYQGNDGTGKITIEPKLNSTLYIGSVDIELTKLNDTEFIISEINSTNHYAWVLNGFSKTPTADLKKEIEQNNKFFIHDDFWSDDAYQTFKADKFELISIKNAKTGQDLQDSEFRTDTKIRALIEYKYDGSSPQKSNLLICNKTIPISSSERNQALIKISQSNSNDPEWVNNWMAYSTAIIENLENNIIYFDIPEEYIPLPGNPNWSKQARKTKQLIIKETSFIFLQDLMIEFQIDPGKGWDPEGFSIDVNEEGLVANTQEKTIKVTESITIRLKVGEEWEKFTVKLEGKYAYYEKLMQN